MRALLAASLVRVNACNIVQRRIGHAYGIGEQNSFYIVCAIQ